MYTIAYPFGDTYVSFGGLEFAIRLSTQGNLYCPSAERVRISEEPGRIRLSADRLSAAGGQLTAEGKLELILEQGALAGSVIVSGRGAHDTELCKSILILVKGIHVDHIESDSDNMGRWEFRHPAGTKTLVYPGRDAMMPLVFFNENVNGNSKTWYALSKDAVVRKKGFAAYYDAAEDARIISLAFEEDRRRWRHDIELPAWHVGESVSKDQIVEERCEDLEARFGLKPFRERSDLAWIDDIKVVVNFHGEHFTGHIFNTFGEMEEQLQALCRQLPGKHILAFLPAWDGRYYYNYPEHEASERMGGNVGLKKFVDTAHALGVKVIPMLGGPNLATYRFLTEHRLLDSAMKDDAGTPQIQDWIDWNSDSSPENLGYIVNYGHPGLREYMLAKTDQLLKQFGFDGIFLDGAIRWSNAPDYSPYEGIVQFSEEFSRRHPGKLLMGEDGYDVLWGLFGLFATSWGPLGLNNSLLRYTRQTEYLAYPALNGSAGVHEVGWDWERINKSKKEFTIPTLALFRGDTGTYEAQIRELLRQYSSWEMKDPD